jgi:hypothetical protein
MFLRNDGGRLLQRTVANLLLFSDPFTLQQRHKLTPHQKNRFSCRTEMSSKPNTLIKKINNVTVNELRFPKENVFISIRFQHLPHDKNLRKLNEIENITKILCQAVEEISLFMGVLLLKLMKPVDVSAGYNLPLRKHYCSYDYSEVPGAGHSRKRAGNLVALKRETVGSSTR